MKVTIEGTEEEIARILGRPGTPRPIEIEIAMAGSGEGSAADAILAALGRQPPPAKPRKARQRTGHS